MEFVDTLSGLVIFVGVLFLGAYGIRHRGAIAIWLNNINHEKNIDEKDSEITQLQREKEDIEKKLKKLEVD